MTLELLWIGLELLWFGFDVTLELLWIGLELLWIGLGGEKKKRRKEPLKEI